MSELTIASNRNFDSDVSDTPWPDQIWVDPDTGTRFSLPARRDYIYGDRTLPVAKHLDYAINAIANNEVVVVSAPTGTGKSTLLIEAIYESGIIEGTTYVTQPRIVTTRENTQWIRGQMETVSGGSMAHIVGYRTATEGDAQPGSKIIQGTDGLILQRMIEDGGITKDDLVIIDEAHEKNINITLVAGLAHAKNIPLVIMSATHDAAKTADHAAKARGLSTVPVIDIDGIRYPVDERDGGKFADVIVQYAQQGLNVLAFVPGARETGATIGRITGRVPNGYTILTLNGDQTISEQKKVFGHYPEGVIVVSTNVGQMGITVPNMDVVVDPGWERLSEYGDGVKALKVQPISRATSIQRKGRVGRTKPGIYHIAQLEGYPPIPQDADGNVVTARYDTPAIQRSDLTSSTLRLAKAGLTLDFLDLEDKPKAREVDAAHHRLVRFGAQTLNTVQLTRIGERMTRVPLDANYARMFIEASNYTANVKRHAAAMLSACQYEGITMTEQGMENWRTLTRENRSDMLVQLDVFMKCLTMEADVRATTPNEQEATALLENKLNAYNIIQQRYLKAKSIYERLCKDVKISPSVLGIPTEKERQDLLACIVTGSNTLFVSRGYGEYTDQAGFDGRFTRSSTIEANAHMVVGSAFRLEHMRNSGIKGHNLIKDATIVTADMLQRYAPQRCTFMNEHPIVDASGRVLASRDLYFDGRPTKTASNVEAEPSQETLDLLVDRLFTDRRLPENASEDTQKFFAEIERIRNLLVDYSDNTMQFEQTMGNYRDIIASWKDLKVNNINILVKMLNRRSVYEWLKQTLPDSNQQVQDILDNAPASVLYEIDGEPYEIPVQYRDNEVYIDVDAHHVKHLSGIEDQVDGRSVWVKAASAKYVPLDEAVSGHTGVNRAARRARK